MIRQRVSLVVAGAFVASSAFTIGLVAPASAAPGPYDPTFTPTTTSNDLVGGGSDTSEIAVDYLAKGRNGTAGFNANKTSGRIASYAATGDPELVLRDGSTIKRPNNSGTGRATLWGTGDNPNFDFARSSSAISTAEQATLRQLPFAVDGLKLAVSSNVASNAPETISEADLVRIYKGEVTNWSQIGGKNGVIKPLIPFSGSGTRTFFEAQLTRINGSPVTPAPSVSEVQEHSVDQIQNDANAVAPFSTGRAKAATSIKLVGGFAANRALYNVVRLSDYTSGAKSTLLKDAFGPNGFVCSPAARPLIEAAGFDQLAATTKGGACGEPVSSATSNFKTSGQAGAVATSTTLSAVAANGGSVRLTADIAAAGLSPQGKVQFKEGDTLLQTVNVAGGQAIATLANVAVGAHTYTASFVPTNDNSFAPSQTAAPVTATVLTSSSLAVSAASGTFGVARVITVTGTGGAANGVVNVSVPGVLATNVQLVNGAASISVPATATVGARTVSAAFGGNATTFGSSASASLSITKASTAAKLKLSKKSIKASKRATAKVTVTINGSALPANGKVTVKAGSKTIGKGTVRNGKATIKLKKLKKGSYKVKATFAGDANIGSSTTETVKLKVTK